MERGCGERFERRKARPSRKAAGDQFANQKLTRVGIELLGQLKICESIPFDIILTFIGVSENSAFLLAKDHL